MFLYTKKLGGKDLIDTKDNIIYGVDTNKKVTPIMIRDAMIQCYYEAHWNILELDRDSFYKPPKKNLKK